MPARAAPSSTVSPSTFIVKVRRRPSMSTVTSASPAAGVTAWGRRRPARRAAARAAAGSAVASVKCSACSRAASTPRSRSVGADLLDHVTRAAHEVLAHRGRIEQRRGKLPHPHGIEPAVVELDLLGLAAHDEVQRQLAEMPILERQQLLEAHGTAGAGVAVEQQHARRAAGEQRPHHRQDRA